METSEMEKREKCVRMRRENDIMKCRGMRNK